MRWIIGDIHGMLRPLETVLGAIQTVDKKARLIFAGDYVNRGPDSRGVVDLLLTLKNATFLRGNHDDVFDHLLGGKGLTCNPGDNERALLFESFMKFGLDKTWISYGAAASDLRKIDWKDAAALGELAQKVPESHHRFFRELQVVVEEKDFFVVHGMWDPNEPVESPSLAQRIENDPKLYPRLLWGRFDESQVKAAKAWKRIGFFGHTPTPNYAMSDGIPRPIVGPKIVLLDTGAFDRHGRLTAVCADNGAVLQSDHSGKPIDKT